MINGQPQGSDQTPNPQTIDPGSDTGPTTTSLPRQAHWNVSRAAGTLTAQCLDTSSQYCTSQGMRLPTVAEAQTLAANNYAACAFPNPWTMWTSTGVSGDSTRAYFMSSAGVQSSQIIDNSPGWALCVSGTQQASPQSLQQRIMGRVGTSARKN